MQDLANRVDDHTIQFVRILPGPIEKIWSYLVDSDKRGEWFAKGDLPDKVGEKFELRWKRCWPIHNSSSALNTHRRTRSPAATTRSAIRNWPRVFPSFFGARPLMTN